MAEAGLKEVETYVARLQNTVAHSIATRSIMDLFLAAEQQTSTRVSNRWWEKKFLELEGMPTVNLGA